jgi:hypothetical protein
MKATNLLLTTFWGHNTVGIKVFLTIFALPEPDPYLRQTDPDPAGQNVLVPIRICNTGLQCGAEAIRFMQTRIQAFSTADLDLL